MSFVAGFFHHTIEGAIMHAISTLHDYSVLTLTKATFTLT